MLRVAVVDAQANRRDRMVSRMRDVSLSSNQSPDACDVVFFLGPSASDGSRIEQYLQSGRHVLLSAEAWLSMEVISGWSGAARQANVRLVVANPDRYLPSRQLIRRQLDAGKLGEPGLVRLHRWECADRQATALLRDLDIVLSYVGKPPNVVYAVEHHAGTQVHLGFPSGAMAMLDHTSRLPDGDGYFSLSVIGSAGAAYADDHQNVQLLYQGGSPRAIRAGEGELAATAMIQDFIDRLTRSEPYPAADWHNALCVADVVRKSLETRRALALALAPEGMLT